MPFIESILLLLIFSRIGGEIAERYGQPAMIGEIIAGVILGPSLFGLVETTREIKAIADLGVLLLVFHVGMEMNLKDLARAFRGKGAWVGVMGFFVPLVMGILVGLLFGFEITRVIFLGLCIAITALPVSVRILMDLGKLQTEIGQRIISAAVINDVTSLLILGIILDVQGGMGTWEESLLAVAWTMIKAILFMAGVVIASRLIFYSTGRIPVSRKLLGWLLARLKAKEPLFAVILLFVVAFAGLSEAVGLHFVIGAFFGSMLLSHEFLGRANFEEVRKIASSVTNGFLGPVFFAMIGLEFDVSALTDWKLVIAVLAVSFAGKILGGYWGGQIAGLGKVESWTLGIGLNGRGIMELVIANIALSNG
ncbi:MAG: cation:proton antiporter, partial [Nitrospiraceae bacterium]